MARHYRPKKTALTRAKIEALRDAVLLGLPYKYACRLCHVPPSSFFQWTAHARNLEARIERGQRVRISQAEALMIDLLREIENARSELIRRGLAKIEVAAEEDWKAWAWKLERLDPETFGRRMYVSAEVPDTSTVKTPAEIAMEMDHSVGPPPELPAPE